MRKPRSGTPSLEARAHAGNPNPEKNHHCAARFERGLELSPSVTVLAGHSLGYSGVTILLISGTASAADQGEILYPKDFRAQVSRTYRNISALLEAVGATWKDVIRTTCYLRDIKRDYEALNEIRTRFFEEQGLDPLPASTGIRAILCRPDLLIEWKLWQYLDQIAAVQESN